MEKNNLEEEFLNHKQSLSLQELGFDEPCFGLFVRDKTFLLKEMPNQKECEQYFGGILAPTFHQAFKWFRKKYGLFVGPSVISYENGPYLWFFDINSTTLPFGTDLGETDDYPTYEESESACIDELIELVKK